MSIKIDYSAKILTDEEANRILYIIGKEVQEDEKENCFVNMKREDQVIAAYRIMEYATKDSDVTVLYKLHEPFESMGYVSIIGKNIHISNTKCFLGAVNLADNMEVYPRTDGKVQMDLGFHRLTTKEVSYEN